MIRLLSILLVCISYTGFAQFTYVDDSTIPVEGPGNTQLTFPFVGGLNASQFNKLDLDGDNIADLVIFDRMAQKLITFITVNQRYQYAPEYEKSFPPIENFLLLRDYNNDGKNDLFTGDPLGIRVYLNTTGDNEPLSWKQYFFTSPGKKQPVILTQGFTLSNLQLQVDDVPSISDVDGDGDLDILSLRYPTGSTVDFHQNMSKEEFNSYDSLKFVRVTQTWGEFKECECGEFTLNNSDCPAGGRQRHTGGKSLLALDANGNGSTDLIISEAECRQAFLLNNAGTSVDAVVDSYRLFPSDSSFFPIFPASFYEDVDFDGVKDLIVSPAVFSKPSPYTDFGRSVSFYKNTATNAAPSFKYIQNNFLQSEMVDVGDNSVPAFIDEDGDGDEDLFISAGDGRLFFFQNTGTPSLPSFKFVTAKYVDLQQKGFYNLKIQFNDFDHNGTKDLAFTATSVDAGTTLYYIANKSALKLDISGATEQAVVFSLTSNDNLHATDVDQDGYADLLVGRSDGTLQYWRNNQLNGTPTFTLSNAEYLSVTTTEFSQYVSVATADLDTDGKPDLVIGDQTGIIKIMSDYRTDANREVPPTTREIIFDNLSAKYEDRNLGGRLWPTIVSFHNSNKPSIVTGNALGGIRVLKNDDGRSLPEIPVVKLYPNPANSEESIYMHADRAMRFFITNSIGQEVTGYNSVPGNEIYKVNINGLSAGVYFIHCRATRGRVTKRIVVY
jgi:hypothetical protein